MSTTEQAGATFDEIVTAEQKEKVVEVVTEIAEVVKAAGAIEVRTPEEAVAATEFLSKVSKQRKRTEAARKFIVDPINAHLRTINAKFKTEAAPLEEAERIVKDKVLAFRREEERLRAEEQARLDREAAERQAAEERARREAEEKARAEREAAAAEAARREAETRAAEAARAKAREEEQDARRRAIAELTDDALRVLLAKPDTTEVDRAWATEELGDRRAARRAQQALEAAKAEAERAAAAEAEVKAAPAPAVIAHRVAAPTALVSAAGAVSERKRWKATIVDPALVPRELCEVSQKLVNQQMRVLVAGLQPGEEPVQIPGVLIEQIDDLAVRAG